MNDHCKREYDPPAADHDSTIMADRIWPPDRSRDPQALRTRRTEIALDATRRRRFGHDVEQRDTSHEAHHAGTDPQPEAMGG